jgi:nucleoside-diphosphate-sugar epimerase
MRILVIGGTGFIGPHLVRELSQMGHTVAVFHRGKTQAHLPAESILGERRDLAAIQLRRPSGVADGGIPWHRRTCGGGKQH